MNHISMFRLNACVEAIFKVSLKETEAGKSGNISLRVFKKTVFQRMYCCIKKTGSSFLLDYEDRVILELLYGALSLLNHRTKIIKKQKILSQGLKVLKSV